MPPRRAIDRCAKFVRLSARISNDPEYLAQVMARAGEATYGWYWAADLSVPVW